MSFNNVICLLFKNKILQNNLPVILTQFRYKKCLDYSKFPKLIEHELEETFVRGSGPGGQAVNKTSNAVVLRHKPSNIVVKCHVTRSLRENQKLARNMLLNKLDLLYNGDQSIQAQEKEMNKKKYNEKLRRRKKIENMKEKWKKNEQSVI